ncbi:MAG: OpgC domain-containing protein, partial [Rhodoplanes sp.]
DVMRFAHFLALATITVYFVPRDWPPLKSRWLKPAILCGQHSLETFCIGVFLAFAAHFAMIEFSGGTAMQILVSILGVAIMVAAAVLMSWYRRIEDRSPGSRSKPPSASPAGSPP